MFLQILETLGTFFGGLGALIAATTQLLTFLKKKEQEEREVGSGSGSGSDEAIPWMILTAY
ncbi:hypothetical protein ACFW4X_28645 [Streptomyces smyrnaeus]|uniref:hypothetical protein n=1 Tax=Streptomyces smyrnaeus TaxID=1387713 RepID=UPI0033DEC014